MQPLYPAIKPYKTHKLAVSTPHVLYIEEVGIPEGIPVICLHDGPGGSGSTVIRRFFDPSRYRMIIFDQRGCGRSTPRGETRLNTTDWLIKDLETIIDFLNLPPCLISGGGFGAMLSLLFSQKYPRQTTGLLLYKIFLGQPEDIRWLYQTGAPQIYPDYWQEFTQGIPARCLDNLPEWFADCIHGDNELARMSAAKSWATWKARCSSVRPLTLLMEKVQDPHFALNLTELETFYIKNNFFMKAGDILVQNTKIAHLPCHIVHGRYDMISPLANALKLHYSLPQSTLNIVRDAGHSELEPSMSDAIVSVARQL